MKPSLSILKSLLGSKKDPRDCFQQHSQVGILDPQSDGTFRFVPSQSTHHTDNWPHGNSIPVIQPILPDDRKVWTCGKYPGTEKNSLVAAIGYDNGYEKKGPCHIIHSTLGDEESYCHVGEYNGSLSEKVSGYSYGAACESMYNLKFHGSMTNRPSGPASQVTQQLLKLKCDRNMSLRIEGAEVAWAVPTGIGEEVTVNWVARDGVSGSPPLSSLHHFYS
jgi:hypothetical protein